MSTPNIFSYATKERSQDAFICWLIACASPNDRDPDATRATQNREQKKHTIRTDLRAGAESRTARPQNARQPAKWHPPSDAEDEGKTKQETDGEEADGTRHDEKGTGKKRGRAVKKLREVDGEGNGRGTETKNGRWKHRAKTAARSSQAKCHPEKKVGEQRRAAKFGECGSSKNLNRSREDTAGARPVVWTRGLGHPFKSR